jgi:hypothetical protein
VKNANLEFENTMLRRIFRHKRDEVAGDWRKLDYWT